MVTTTQSHIPELPAELVSAVTGEAYRDADRVNVFLKALGLVPRAGRQLQLPATFLLDLGAALRLMCWEQCGVCIHLHAGLPSARQALLEVLRSLTTEPDSSGTSTSALPYKVMLLFVERFAWNGWPKLGADVTLELAHADEESLLEALADFLWEHRSA